MNYFTGEHYYFRPENLLGLLFRLAAFPIVTVIISPGEFYPYYFVKRIFVGHFVVIFSKNISLTGRSQSPSTPTS